MRGHGEHLASRHGVPAQRASAETAPGPLAGRSVALVHEWFGATGGSEEVFRHIGRIVPHGERFVLWKDHDAVEPGLRESWLARTPLRRAKAAALPFMPLAWRTLSRERFDVVISSSHAFAHTVRLGSPARTRYLSYVHSPARYVWSPDFDGRGSSPLLTVPRRLLQVADVQLSRHVHAYAANSREVRARIQRYWRRDAVVINPPVDTDYFMAAPDEDRNQPRDYLLGVGRWIPYKNFDLIIEIAHATGLPLVIAGSGPEEEALRRLADRASVQVTFILQPNRDRLRRLYWGARALLFPVHEDFGMIPVEAQACGTPVLGLRRGGLLETVAHGETGFLVDSRDPGAYVPLVRRLGELAPDRMAAQASRFSTRQFAARMSAWIAEAARA
ncbi:glycosyltransferase [Phytohabitans houttuyneae]|uniref:Glycosyl transferase n=1 Tax=Phytohabitans houttuyneae TaxID=1076126 RepID=A0A6V8KJX8_9ACTN|nr:glycosyltransferase [Phytohabitans houttuyneae]GFJ85502.1 glycosyl transferase [Phytohabitans houttuyneae]